MVDDRLGTTPGPRNVKKEWAIWMVVASAIIGFYMSGFYLEEGISIGSAVDFGEDEFIIHGDRLVIGLIIGAISILLIISAYRIERRDKADLAIGGLVLLILFGVEDMFVMDLLGPLVIVLGLTSLAAIFLLAREGRKGDERTT